MRASAHERAARDRGRDQALRRRHRQRGHLAGGAGEPGGGPDRAERVGQVDALQLHRRLPPGGRRLDPLRGPRDHAPAHGGDRAPRAHPHLPADPRLRADDGPPEHGDQRCRGRARALPAHAAGLGGDAGAGGSPARLLRPLRQAPPDGGRALLRPAQAAGARDGADGAPAHAAAGRAHGRHQPDADQRRDRAAAARQPRVRRHALRHRAQHARHHEPGRAYPLPRPRPTAGQRSAGVAAQRSARDRRLPGAR